MKTATEIIMANTGPHNVYFPKTPEGVYILELHTNGDIYVKGKLIENDKEVVQAMRELLNIS